MIDITKGYGELLREFIKTTSNKVGEVTVKGATKLTEVTKKGMGKVGHRDKKNSRDHWRNVRKSSWGNKRRRIKKL